MASSPEQEPHRIHWRPMRAVMLLRVLVLMVLAGFSLAVILSYGRKGSCQTEITMAPGSPTPGAEGPVVDRSDQFEVNGTRYGRPAFTLKARTVTGFAGDRKLLQGVDLLIHDDRGDVKVSGIEGQFDVSERRARLSGDVTVESETEGLKLSTGTLFYDNERDMIFTADDIVFSVGGMSGQGRGMNYLLAERQIKIPDRVLLRFSKEMAGQAASISSGDMVAALETNAAVFTDNVRLERGGDVLYSNYVKIEFDEGRKTLRRMQAFGDVIMTRAAGPDGQPHELRSDSLAAEFSGPPEEVKVVDLSGNCRVTSGPYTSLSHSARYRKADDVVELRGDPVVKSTTDRIAAQEIDVHPDHNTLEARGDVRTVSMPSSKAGAAMPGFGGRSAVSFQARTLLYDQGGQRATYQGTARVWQEGNSIQAEEIVVEQQSRQLRATNNVMARFTQRRPATSGPPGRPVVTVITSGSMVYDDAQAIGRYRDNVHLTREDTALTSDAMDAYLKDRSGVRELDRIEAEGSVAVKRAQAFGTARSAEYRQDDDTLILRDESGLATVVDSATGRTLRGRTLTFDLTGDRILTETAQGARTWITLKPEAKDVQSVEPKTQH